MSSVVAPGVDYRTALLLGRDPHIVERLDATDLVAAAVDPLL